MSFFCRGRGRVFGIIFLVCFLDSKGDAEFEVEGVGEAVEEVYRGADVASL